MRDMSIMAWLLALAKYVRVENEKRKRATRYAQYLYDGNGWCPSPILSNVGTRFYPLDRTASLSL